MFQWLIELDKKAFLYFNSIHSLEWDNIMWWVTKTETWIPLHIILLLFIIYKERPYRFIFTILFVAITVTLCDQISVLIKNLVERPRPSHNSEFTELIHLVFRKNGEVYRGGTYGFVSSHAANVFGVATFLSNQFKHFRWSLFLFAWAALIAYSRVYLGVHYPLDIICGAMLGILIGIQFYMFKVWTVVHTERYIADRKAEKRQARRAEEKREKKNV